MNKFAVAFISFVFGVMLRTAAPLLVNFLQQKIAEVAVRRKWKVGVSGGLGGVWNHAWYAQGSSSWPDENLCHVTLSSIGPHFAGIYTSGQKYWLVTGVRGQDNIISGNWRDLKPGGYRGTWLGKLDNNDKSITGWYLGTSDRGPIGAGEWIWWREGAEKPRLPEPIMQAAPRQQPADVGL